MKVSGPGQAQGPSKTKKSGKAGASSGDFGAYMAAGSKESAPTTNTQSIAMVDALLTIQGAEDPSQGASKRRMRARANTVLNELDKLRMAMLTNQLTVGHMIDIADVVASHREKITDPELTGLMDEIDLRAQVELAKMRVALDRQALKRENQA
jgi:hypothetical protein